MSEDQDLLARIGRLAGTCLRLVKFFLSWKLITVQVRSTSTRAVRKPQREAVSLPHLHSIQAITTFHIPHTTAKAMDVEESEAAE